MGIDSATFWITDSATNLGIPKTWNSIANEQNANSNNTRENILNECESYILSVNLKM